MYGVHASTPPAIAAEILYKIYDRLQPSPDGDRFTWCIWVHTLAAYHWLLRPNEHTGPTSGILVRDARILTLEGTGAKVARVDLYYTKGLLRVGSTECESTRTVEMPGSPLDLVSTLEVYMRRFNLERFPDQLLFPAVTPAGALLERPMTMDEYNAALRGMLAAAGLPTHFSSRGLRSGRRSDLRNAGTPLDVVCQLGRWKSEKSSERYQRSDDTIASEIKGYAYLAP